MLRSVQLTPAVAEARQHVLDTVARLTPQLAALHIPLGEGVGAELPRSVQDAVGAQVPLPATLAPTPGMEAILRAQLTQAFSREVGSAPPAGDHRDGDEAEPS